MSNDAGNPRPDPRAEQRARSAAPSPSGSRAGRPPTDPRQVRSADASPSQVRPARPQAPTRPASGPRLEGVLEQDEQVQSIEAIVPSGLSTSTYLPSARRSPEFDRRRNRLQQYQFRQMVVPSAIVLSVSTFLMAIGWFMLDATSALRDNSLGKTIPITLFAISLAFAMLTALLVSQAGALRRAIDADVDQG